MNLFNYKLLARLAIFSIVIFIFILGLLDFKMSNFELLLNPKLVTPVSPVYYIKIGREGMQSLFVFGDEDLANWYFDLSAKRIKEAKILQQHNFQNLANKQIALAKKHQDQGFRFLKPLIDVVDTNFLKEKFETNRQEIKNFNRF